MGDKESIAHSIIEEICDVLDDRNIGFDSIDDECRDEIKDTLMKIVLKKI